MASACSSDPPSAQAIADLVEKTGGGVWAVLAEGCGWRNSGSAFAIDPHHLVTNRHVIANDSSPMIKSRDGQERAGKVIGSAAQPDVAVIEVEEPLPLTLPWAPTESLAKREPLVVLGYPEPAKTFKVSTGEIVNFQGPEGTREAALANTPIERGNSGGPGLRANASVAGVVTQMLLTEGSNQRVAILFTSDTVRPTIAKFIERPTKVLSNCGLGPDYIPPVPKTYDIPAPPPTAKPLQALPAPAAKPRIAEAPPPTTDPLANYPQWTEPPPPPCPDGRAVAQVDEVTATESQAGPGWWTTHVKGRVINESTSEIFINRIDVEIAGDPKVEGQAEPERKNVEPQGIALWEFGDVDVYSPEKAPTKETTAVALDWQWTGEAISCPTS